ncbi:MAG: Flp family type IVb pilin [Hyphomicrobiales bacterium]
MTAIKNFFADLHRDEEGAAFLEYTVLLGIILAVSIAVIFSIGAWAGDVWGVLCTQLEEADVSGVTFACDN